MKNGEKDSCPKNIGDGNILITGANGQLGRCFQKHAADFDHLNFLFSSSEELDITSSVATERFFEENAIDVCINCAAYTKVEQAETEIEKAFLINAEAVKDLAKICKKNNTVLIHFSTDYVFDGEKDSPYLESDSPNPINVYGASKLKGEQEIQQILERYFIFRTSWLYSEFGHNFYKTILRKSEEEGAKLKITTEQTGTPTNANDLAKAVLQLISDENENYGLYHYANTGETTWHGFAEAVLKNEGLLNQVNLQKSNAYKTIAKRPEHSVLNSRKAAENLGVSLIDWKESLHNLQNSK
ncbi:MAG TPA: dTDP-4-dehydrorhamnose reductase [Flavobacteriaceae bacterium]|nr:dTDP-4-dehydrorhamnose reductase [Flavobacteriaceae bacterium]